jgi:hypothetical protein
MIERAAASAGFELEGASAHAASRARMSQMPQMEGIHRDVSG